MIANTCPTHVVLFFSDGGILVRRGVHFGIMFGMDLFIMAMGGDNRKHESWCKYYAVFDGLFGCMGANAWKNYVKTSMPWEMQFSKHTF